MGWSLVLIGLLMLPSPTQAQTDSLEALYVQGTSLARKGRYQQAVPLLYRVFRQDPAYVDDQGYSVAYWLGLALKKADREDEALAVWSQGLSALHRSNRFDPLAADAYIHTVFEEDYETQYLRASWAYLELLRSLDTPTLNAEARKVVDRHVAQMEFLLPPSLRDQVRPDRRKPAVSGMGEKLVVWWQAQDPVISTPQNERLIEHLQRVIYAEKHYATNRRRSRLDDRGIVYVRLGPPKFTSKIHMQDRGINKSTMSPYRSGLDLNPNEFWSYRHIDPLLYYLFVEKDGYYQIGLPSDLVPQSLLHSSYFQYRWAALLETWQIIYGQLALLHPDFVKQSIEVDNMITGITGRANPDNFVMMRRMHFKRQEQISAAQRDRIAPAVFSAAAYDNVENMPVEARVARFLDQTTGKTRIEVFWGHNPVAVSPGSQGRRILREQGYADSGHYLIDLYAMTRTADYQLGDFQRQRYTLSSTDPTLSIQTVTLQGAAPIFHVALQWDVYATEPLGDGQYQLGPRFKMGTFRIDTLQALSADPAQLEMSDLVPVLRGVFPENPDSLVRYPFLAITSETKLGLRFEVYHLQFGPDDRTHYTVEYAVIREKGGRDETVVAARTEYTGQSRTAQEYIEVDLQQIPERGHIRVRVTVTDQQSGQQVAREISFNLIS
ncbi:GWxTD domain-containing protein [Rhodothermus profundi]|uniref:GWxTD domain-containing protein n=1 Tax=Rhodothermus profundi TaxID=633813 RepID=A0A1M6W9C7_9BACT|nr:GWxTD domain-containing protein [Rhodothermus profundi]SHK90258.1 GWxTD domain-containing protein [Rhodothermus profundi]